MDSHASPPELSRGVRLAATAGIFGPQADSVVHYIEQDISVHIIGRRCSGRSALLSDVANRLRAAGRPVLRIAGMRSWREEPFAAIFAVGNDATETHRPVEIAQMIANTHLGKPGAVLVCDDAGELDPQSVGVLATAVREHHATAVTASLQTTGLEANSLAMAISPAVCVRVDAVDRVALQKLAVSVLGEPLEPGALTELAVKSGGLVGVAHALLTVGRHKGRLVRMSGGTYTINGQLWTDDLTWIAERLLAGVTNAERADARSLALAGPISLEDAKNLLGRRHLRRLADSGLTYLADVGDLRLVNVFPPLLADYLAHEPSEDDQPGSGLRPPKLDFTEAIPAQSIALLAQRAVADSMTKVRERRAAWREAPSAETALALFLAMEQAGTPDSEIEEILIRTPLSESDATTNLLIWYQSYHILREADPLGAIARLSELYSKIPAYSHVFRVGMMHISFLCGLPVDVEELAELINSDDPFVAAIATQVEIERLISLGRTISAAALLDTLRASGNGIPELLDLLTDLNAILSDNAAAGTRDVLSRISTGEQVMTNAAGMGGYIGLIGLIICGQLAKAFTLVQNLMALEPPSEMGSLVSGILLASASLTSTWTGQPSFARPMTKQANILPVDGPFPGMDTAVAVAFELGIANPAEAGEQLWKMALECFDRGFILRGVYTITLALDFSRDTVGAITRMREVVDTLESPLAQAMAQYALAADDHDVDGIGAAAITFREIGAEFFAIKAAITQILEMRNSERRKLAADLADAEWQRLDELGLSNPSLFARLRNDVGLSAREVAILQLAADGMAYSDIASEFDISTRTVDSHFLNISKKVGFTSRERLGRSIRTWLSPSE